MAVIYREDLPGFCTFNNNATQNGNQQSEEELLKVIFIEKWGCDDSVLKNAYSWHLIEAGRRLISETIS